MSTTRQAVPRLTPAQYYRYQALEAADKKRRLLADIERLAQRIRHPLHAEMGRWGLRELKAERLRMKRYLVARERAIRTMTGGVQRRTTDYQPTGENHAAH